MPHETTMLSAFQRRDTTDKVMFGFVQGIQHAIPRISVEHAITIFARIYKLEESFNISSNRQRYQRMVQDFFEDKRTTSQDAQKATS